MRRVKTPAGPTGGWNDAIAARLIAPRLHTKHERDPTDDPWRHRCATRTWPITKTVGGGFLDGCHLIGNRVLLIVRDHERRTRERLNLVRRTRRVAPGGHHPRVGIHSLNTPERLACPLVGRRRHGTTVDDDEIRLVSRRPRATASPQLHLEL